MKNSPRLRRCIGLLSLGLAVLSGCGRKGPLVPPIPKRPQPAQDLRIIQRGSAFYLYWRNPSAYIDGRPLEAVGAVQIWMWAEIKSAEAPAAPVDRSAFPANAALLKSLAEAELSGLAWEDGQGGAWLRYRREFAPADIGTKRFLFALKVLDGSERSSEWSGIVEAEPKPAPLPPGEPSAILARDRVSLRWKAPEKNIDQGSPAVVAGYLVYRAVGEGRPGRLNSQPVSTTEYEDTSIEMGARYRYFVRASATPAPPYLESDDSLEVEVAASDTFAPAAPEGVTAIAGDDFVSLGWTPGPESDLADYRIWRRIKGEERFSLLTEEGIPGSSYVDRRIERNVRYQYAVTARDGAGNESPKSAIVETVVTGRMP